AVVGVSWTTDALALAVFSRRTLEVRGELVPDPVPVVERVLLGPVGRSRGGRQPAVEVLVELLGEAGGVQRVVQGGEATEEDDVPIAAGLNLVAVALRFEDHSPRES